MVDSSSASQSEFDINQIATDLNNKLDKDGSNIGTVTGAFIQGLLNSGIDIVVERGTDPTTGYWYRLWASGWCEQGGLSTSTTNGRTINLLKPYKDTNYTINVLGLASAQSGDYCTIVSTTRTTSSFIVFLNRQCNWYACGQT